MPRLQRSESVGLVAAGLWTRLDRTGEGLPKARAVAAWRAAAGEEVYAHARGFALRGDELLVYVDSPVWANELNVLTENYRAAVNERLGKEVVGTIRFNVSRSVGDERVRDAEDASVVEAAAIPRVDPQPATETEIEQIRSMAEGLQNADMREAVIAAAIAHLEWRKGIEALNAAERAVQGSTGLDSQSLP